ncbi:PQQ-binding-like beta-propeller repeat protein [Haladaptatus sp.]|uniref:outer membrane protein assembly factor BamB family protein n=1 Tax=Haladaptatus sp. TaxID=1973141 RepID=UPI003C5FDABB
MHPLRAYPRPRPTGDERWQTENKAVSRDIGNAVSTAANGSVFLGTEDVTALDQGTGKEQWVGKYRKSTTTWGIATTGKRTVAIAAFDGEKGTLASFGLDGTRQWTTSIEVSNEPPRPTIADGTAYVANGAGTLYAVALENGAVQWKVTIDDGVKTGIAVYDGTVFVPGGADGTLRAIDAGDGTVRWTQHVGQAAAPGVVEKQLLVSGTDVSGPKSDAGVAVFDPATGEKRRTYAVNIAGPFAVGDGAIYVRHVDDSSLWTIR